MSRRIQCPVELCSSGNFKNVKSFGHHWRSKHRTDKNQRTPAPRIVEVVEPTPQVSAPPGPTLQRPAPLDLMKVTLDDFKDCRFLEEKGKFSLYSATAKIFGISVDDAGRKIRKANMALFAQIEFHRYPGPGRGDTPIVTLSEFLAIVSKLPGAPADLLRSEQAEIAARANNATNPSWPIFPINPLRRLNLMNLTMDDFRDCRFLEEKGKFSLYEATAKIFGISTANAGRKIRKTSWALLDQLEFYQFPGARQRLTPIVTLSEFLAIVSKLPGAPADLLRSEQAEIAARANNATNPSWPIFPSAERKNVPDTNEQEVNPLHRLNLMNLTMDDFRDCRFLEEKGKFSLYSATAKIFGISTANAGRKIRENPHRGGFPQIEFHRYPGPGRGDTPIVTLSEFLAIVSKLPGAPADLLRSEQAEIATRAFAGDVDLERALPEQRANLGAEVRQAAMQGLESTEEAKAENALPPPPEDPVQKALRVRREVVQVRRLELEADKIEFSVVNMDFDLLSKQITLLSSLGMDERDKVFCKDLVRKQLSRKRKREEEGVSQPPQLTITGNNNSTTVVANNSQMTQNEEEKRREISIPLVCAELGLNPRGKEAQIGRRMAKLWRGRYNLPSDAQPPKRDCFFGGRPFRENAYFSEDYDLMTQACREIAGA